MPNPFKIIKSNFNKEEFSTLLNHYLNNIEWEQDTYSFGLKTVTPRRKTYMMGKSYNYSGQTKVAHPFDEETLKIKELIEEQLDLKKGYFNGCLLNLYEDGLASISPHKDDEKDMVENAIIVSFSIGSSRKFIFQNDDKAIKKEVFVVEDGDILVMLDGCQKEWRHSIPKEIDVTEPRISLTFRRFK